MTSSVSDRFEAAITIHKAGDIDSAEKQYLQLIEEFPETAGAHHMLGVVYLQRKNFVDALQAIGRAIEVDVSKAVYFNNYGAALRGLGRNVDALACFHRAAEMRSDYVDAILNLGETYELFGHSEQAVRYFEQAFRLEPERRNLRNKVTALLAKLGEGEEALRIFEEELRRHPTAELRSRVGNLLIATGRVSEAIGHFEAAIVEEPDNAIALFSLGNALHEQHRTTEATSKFKAAANLRPKQWLWKLRPATVCPAVFESSQQIDDYCEELSTTLDHWCETRPEKLRCQDFIQAAAFPNFTFSYLGRNVRTIKEKFGAFYEHYFRDMPDVEGSGLVGKRRLGIVVTHRHEGIFLRCMSGILRGLSKDLFEIVILCSKQSIPAIRNGLGMPDVRIVGLPSTLERAADTIRTIKCDIVYYWEVGSDALNYFLPYCKLAPIQCTSHGSQVTTGNPNIDHFYSSELIEVGTAQDHYSEKLWLSNSLLIHQPRLNDPTPAGLASFRLPEDRTIYMALQNPLKFHPDFDSILAGILASDPSGLVVLLRGSYEYAEHQLRQRFARTFGQLQRRVIFLPYLDFTKYCQLMKLADVVLDPVHFGHGSSAYDVFSFDKPMVTMPTSINVGRVGTAFCAKLDLPELVARNPDDYIAKAVQLGMDQSYRRAIAGRIAERTAALFNDEMATIDHQKFFNEIQPLRR